MRLRCRWTQSWATSVVAATHDRVPQITQRRDFTISQFRILRIRFTDTAPWVSRIRLCARFTVSLLVPSVAGRWAETGRIQTLVQVLLALSGRTGQPSYLCKIPCLWSAGVPKLQHCVYRLAFWRKDEAVYLECILSQHPRLDVKVHNFPRGERQSR